MAQSSEEPKNIQIDYGKLKNGKIDILVHWDIEQKARSDNSIYWEYNECRLNWVLPEPYTKSEIQTYFNNNYNTGENILKWAQASKLNSINIT
jgi:hypothetical protein